MQLVEEPVNIEEGRGELVKNESGAVKVDEWALAREISCQYCVFL